MFKVYVKEVFFYCSFPKGLFKLGMHVEFDQIPFQHLIK